MANQKAKLVWNGKAYFDEDLIAVCKKETHFLCGEFIDYRLDRDFSRIAVKMNKRGSVTIFYVPFDALKMYNIGEDRTKPVLTINQKGGVKKSYTSEDIMAIGSSVSLVWGGKCMNYSIDKKAGIIITEIVDQNSVQQVLFIPPEDRSKRNRLMKAMDSINQNDSTYNMVHTASCDPEMRLSRKGFNSQQYTTRLSDIITIRCK